MPMAGLGLRSHLFTAGSQDVNNRFVASQLLYGSPLALPVPDVLRTDFLVVIGANPVVSHGSVLTVPRIRDRMQTSSDAAAGCLSSIHARPRPRPSSNGSASFPTGMPTCCCRCCR
jgi:hypothetical protein